MSREYKFPREFLDLVRTMPFIEAEELLRDRRIEVLQRLHEAKDGEEKVNLGYILSALNDELHVVGQKMNRLAIGRAIRQLFGEEGYAKWREWRAMNEAQASEGHGPTPPAQVKAAARP